MEADPLESLQSTIISLSFLPCPSKLHRWPVCFGILFMKSGLLSCCKIRDDLIIFFLCWNLVMPVCLCSPLRKSHSLLQCWQLQRLVCLLQFLLLQKQHLTGQYRFRLFTSITCHPKERIRSWRSSCPITSSVFPEI